MANLTRWIRPSIPSLRRDIDDALDDFMSPRGLRREIERLFGQDLAPRALWQEMDRIFEDFVSPMPLRRRVGALFEPFFGGGMAPLALGGMRGGRMFVPDVELVERDDEYTLSVDVPGVRPEDVQVQVDDDNVLTVRGERRDEQRRQERGYEYTERSYGSFSRSVALPRGVDSSRIDAEYRDGVLQLHIPKSEQAMGRRIPVRARERELGQGRDMSREQQQRQQGQQGREQPRVMGPDDGGQKREPRQNAR